MSPGGGEAPSDPLSPVSRAIYLQSYAARYGAEENSLETRFYKYAAALGLGFGCCVIGQHPCKESRKNPVSHLRILTDVLFSGYFKVPLCTNQRWTSPPSSCGQFSSVAVIKTCPRDW